MKLFMDNVPSLAIQAPIVRGIPSMLCPADVYSMTSEIVAKVAGESEEKTAHRAQLLHKRRTLETGSRICKQFAVRPSHCKLPSNTLPMDSQFTKRVGLSAPVESGQSRDRSTMSNRAGKVRSLAILQQCIFCRSLIPKPDRSCYGTNEAEIVC